MKNRYFLRAIRLSLFPFHPVAPAVIPELFSKSSFCCISWKDNVIILLGILCWFPSSIFADTEYQTGGSLASGMHFSSSVSNRQIGLIDSYYIHLIKGLVLTPAISWTHRLMLCQYDKLEFKSLLLELFPGSFHFLPFL